MMASERSYMPGAVKPHAPDDPRDPYGIFDDIGGVDAFLDEHDAAPEVPEDLRNLLARAVRLRDHMDENQTDYQNKRALQNTESKIRRLIDYYRGDELDEEFTYSYEAAVEILE